MLLANRITFYMQGMMLSINRYFVRVPDAPIITRASLVSLGGTAGGANFLKSLALEHVFKYIVGRVILHTRNLTSSLFLVS